MSFDSFLKFSRWLRLSKSRPHDFADTLHFPYTSIVFLIFVCVMWFKQFVIKPLECWVPKEFSDPWEEYVEYYCWVTGTYYRDVKADILTLTQEERQRGPLNYYQWVPYFMLVQSLLFWVPCVMWKVIAGTTSIPIASLLHVANGVAYEDDEHRERAAIYIARCLLDVLAQKPSRRADGKQRNKRPMFGIHSGSYITLMYFLLKIFLIFHSGLELYFIIVFTNADSMFYGFDALRDMMYGNANKRTTLFPYVAWCDFEIQSIGNVHRYSIMCVLPNNMLYEKMFLFMWWWLALLAVVEFISVFSWLKRLFWFRHRQQFIYTYLQQIRAMGYDRDKRMCKEFITTFLHVDGVFLLHLITDNSGGTFAGKIVGKMWKVYIEKDDERRAMMQGLQGMKTRGAPESQSRRTMNALKSSD